MTRYKERIIIVGAGPCGLSAALECQKRGLDPLIIEKGNIVQSIQNYPTHQQFFSTSEKLEIGNLPFVTEDRKPKRNQALAYYREVVRRTKPRIKPFEEVMAVKKMDEHYQVETRDRHGNSHYYDTDFVIIATGYYDHPNMMNVPGENLPHVFHYFKEGHPYFDCSVTVIGGKNSSVDAALELNKAGARVTVLYRGSDYSTSIKPWILPEFEALVRTGDVNMVFNAEIKEITINEVVYQVAGHTHSVKSDFVFAMTGYHPDHSLLKTMGIQIEDETGRPVFNPDSMETNVPGIFIAGVISAGNNANEIFIENGRFHGGLIADALKERLNS